MSTDLFVASTWQEVWGGGYTSGMVGHVCSNCGIGCYLTGSVETKYRALGGRIICGVCVVLEMVDNREAVERELNARLAPKPLRPGSAEEARAWLGLNRN